MNKNLVKDLNRHGYEKTEEGIYIPHAKVTIGGVFTYEHIRQGDILSVESVKNIVVDQGLNHILDVVLHGVTPVNPWYVGLFEGNYTPIAGDTAATFPTNAVECTAYDEAARQEYNEAAAASKSITNSANKAVFTFNATKTIYGGFIVSVATKGASTGTLLAANRSAAAKSVIDDDQILVSYTLSISST